MEVLQLVQVLNFGVGGWEVGFFWGLGSPLSNVFSFRCQESLSHVLKIPSIPLSDVLGKVWKESTSLVCCFHPGWVRMFFFVCSPMYRKVCATMTCSLRMNSRGSHCGFFHIFLLPLPLDDHFETNIMTMYLSYINTFDPNDVYQA